MHPSAPAPIQVLLAEDNRADQRLITEALRHHHLTHELHIVENGEDAVKAAESAGHNDSPCPDILILDLHLPRVDGVEVLRAFRNNASCKNTPVIVFTSLWSPAERTATESFAGVRLVAKPGSLDEFLEFGAIVKASLLRSHASH